MKKSVKIGIVGIVLIIIIALALYFAFFSKPTGQVASKDDFAKCLSEKGATFYGAEWCGHCQNQKAMFGDSFQYIKYVECTEKPELCQLAGVQAYPTWIINGQKYEGEMIPLELAARTGCQLP